MPSWDSDQLFLKAKAYVDRANSFDDRSVEFHLWSALALELLARAALTKIHPVLNADPREVDSILFGLGLQSKTQPRSLPVHAVFERLQRLIPGFGKTQKALCEFMMLLRNEELHSAGLPFSTLEQSQWLAQYYDVCTLLCVALAKPLASYFGDTVADVAQRMVSSLGDDIISRVKGRIASHRRTFESHGLEERAALTSKASAAAAAATLNRGHQVAVCPACRSEGVIDGELVRELEPTYRDGALYVKEEFIAVEFQCTACNLKLRQIEELAAGGISSRFVEERETSLHELFEAEQFDEYENM